MTTLLTNSTFSSNMFTAVALKFDTIVNEFENYLYSADNIHILAITLVALIIVSCFFATIFLALKLIPALFKIKPTELKKDSSQEEPLPSEEPEELALETELQSELAKNDTETKIEIIDDEKTDIPVNEQHSSTPHQQELEKESKEKEQARTTKENPLFALDWQKKRKTALDQAEPQYQPQLDLRKNLRDLIGMIVNMLGRNIDELKIAQALMYRCKDDLSEESALQIVLSIQEFVTLCNHGAFNNVRRLKDLPSDEDCILHLIAGDTSYAMTLLEALMDEKINLAVNTKKASQRNAIFREASDYACYFGTMAEINDPNLATASFELAVEMYPDSALAWSRCADIYKKTGLEDKANWAYRNVLKLARQENERPLEANAYKYLSQYLYSQGEGNQAAQLFMQSKSFYDSIGINRPLDRKELEIIELIDNTETNNIVNSVLSRQIQNNL